MKKPFYVSSWISLPNTCPDIESEHLNAFSIEIPNGSVNCRFQMKWNISILMLNAV